MPVRRYLVPIAVLSMKVDLMVLVVAPRTAILVVLVLEFIRLLEGVHRLVAHVDYLHVEPSIQGCVCTDYGPAVECVGHGVEVPIDYVDSLLVEFGVVDHHGLVSIGAACCWAGQIIVILVCYAEGALLILLNAFHVPVVAAEASAEVVGYTVDASSEGPAILLTVTVVGGESCSYVGEQQG